MQSNCFEGESDESRPGGKWADPRGLESWEGSTQPGWVWLAWKSNGCESASIDRALTARQSALKQLTC